MHYTTQGLMTPADLADHHARHDTGIHPRCPGHEGDGGGWPTYCTTAAECPGDGFTYGADDLPVPVSGQPY